MPGNNGGGRRVTEVSLDAVKSLARKGLNNAQIAAALGISNRSFYGKKKNQKAFSDAVNAGRSEGVALVADALVKNAIHGNNVTAQIFFLKCHAGWRDNTNEGIETGTASNPLVIKLSGDGNSTHKSAE